MSKLKDRLKHLDKTIKKDWQDIDSKGDLSTREKLEKLVGSRLKKSEPQPSVPVVEPQAADPGENEVLISRTYNYRLDVPFGPLTLGEWRTVTGEYLALITGDSRFSGLDPLKLVYFDTETTGLSGGTGTIPFMLGFGYFAEERFSVQIFILKDPTREEEFLEEVDIFLDGLDISGIVTYNGKSFDFPLMETRYILSRRRFPLMKMPHLDFLFPARTIWKHTYESRKLGYLGDTLLGISRDDDIPSSQIPALYFSYLRTNHLTLLEKVIEHNALDLVGLSALLLLGIRYLVSADHTSDEGEILGVARLYERYGDLSRAEELYRTVGRSGVREVVVNRSVKSLSVLLKKRKLFAEAAELWQLLDSREDHHASRELSIHLEHREKNYIRALEVVSRTIERDNLPDGQRRDLEKRLERLKKKIAALDEGD